MSISVLFAGGGTGGHVCPAVAVARALERLSPGSKVLFLGTGRPVETRILGRAGMPHVALPSSPVTGWRTVPRAMLGNLWGLARGYLETRRFMPDVVLGLGGYASAPGVLAGRALGARVALFEPNARAGRATTTLAPLAREVYVHWIEGAEGVRARAVVSGTPLNEQAVAPAGLSREDALASFGLPADRPCVLVVGGSQGARALNRWILEAAPRGNVSFIHVSGPEDEAALRKAYAGVAAAVVPFVDTMGTAYRAASLAVCRSGAATLAEVAAEGLPSIVVPYPRAALDHQRANARAFELRGGGKLLEEQSLSAHVLEQVIAMAEDATLLSVLGKQARAQARPDAASLVARHLLALADSPVMEPAPRTDRKERTAAVVSASVRRVPARAA
jgi:UDP-N-acetylglucosamine--N-acetylmuramyl-(pentapeptide) pyrophosphoryl-undecaprenol N-acetylglucosamine transferase